MSNLPKISHTASMTTGSSITMGDIRTLADTEGVPDSAILTIHHYAGDFRESGYNTITIMW